ncbi:hypothetical protein EUTSA_v10005034mg [Eutrema salsugineum]|uniref:Uncharacterized protein n=1 Tax=Eutrema salsugineum TaxID=72664 RepID=V4KYT5_EUTSA|nr:hypothetical protein EUTSA_v10005034mg [Eutrema salsugineum]
MHSGHRLSSTPRLVSLSSHLSPIFFLLFGLNLISWFFFFGSHLYRLKGRLHPCISPSENGVINGKGTSEKMKVEAFIWANKDDPDMYGEWDFEEWKRLHMEKFIEASKKFIEWKKNPDGRTREEFAKFVNEDPPVA